MSMVSIISPVFNSSDFIQETIYSVIAQTYKDWELILVDDCSSDDSVECIKSISDKVGNIKLIKLDVNSGAAVARNVAIEMARGRYIAFLDSDDLWLPDKLEKQVSFMQEYGHSFCYSAYEKIDGSGKVFGRVGVPEKVKYSDLLKVCSVGCLTAIYDTHKLGKVTMPLIRKRQDLGLWLRLLKKTPYAYGIPEVLAQYRVRNDSISANKRIAAQYTWRLYRDVEGLKLPAAIYYFSHYAVSGVLRTKLPRLARVLGVLY